LMKINFGNLGNARIGGEPDRGRTWRAGEKRAKRRGAEYAEKRWDLGEGD